MPPAIDLVLALLVGVAYPLVDHFWSWPRMRRGILARTVDARVPAYAEIVATQWLAVAVVAGAWATRRLPWGDLRLVLPGGWRAALALALAAGLAWLARIQQGQIARLGPEARARVWARMGGAEMIVPRSPRERGWFLAVSVTAGICEEFLFRGYLIRVLSPLLGAWGAAAASLASFTAGHAYQGRQRLPNVALVGALFTLLTFATGSVLPAMLLHAMVDVMGGEAAYALAPERA